MKKKILVYQASSRTAHHINVTCQPVGAKSTFATIMGVEDNDRTKDWPKHDPDPRNCTGHGHAECMRQGTHSWFNHSQDSYHANPGLSNLPAGFVEP